MILNFMERYFYLICFASYALNAGPGGFQTTFKAWMDERPHLRKGLGSTWVTQTFKLPTFLNKAYTAM